MLREPTDVVEPSTHRPSTDGLNAEPRPSWWVPVLLAVPSAIPLVSSIVLARSSGLFATGFVQFDQPSYLANAREYFDEGFHFFYGNPYASYDTPRIYSQPHFFLLGCLQQFGLDPGITWNIFAALGTLFAAFVAVRFYRELVGWRTPAQKLGLICFFWGGGILTLTGLAYAIAVGRLNIVAILHFDPSQGWWMLNFGRNLVYGPTEAYYHGVFLLCMLYLILRRFTWAIAFAVLLSWSHPYTGLESCLIVLAYLLIERFYGDKSVKLSHLIGSGALVVAHLGYYLVFLNRFADHRVLQSQWEQSSTARLYLAPAFVPALFLVGVLAVARLVRWPGLRRVISDPRNRLFLVWFLIVFGISQHFRFIKPIEPIHFAHGYDWTALFFLGSPLLLLFLERLLKVKGRAKRVLAISAFMTLFLLDNIAWFATFAKPYTSQAIIVTNEQKEVLDWLGRNTAPREMVVTADLMVSYLVGTYTRVRSWAGHGAVTPHYRERVEESEQAFRHGVIPSAWRNMHVLYVKRTVEDAAWKAPPTCSARFRDARYEIWECPPLPASADASQLPPPLSDLNHR